MIALFLAISFEVAGAFASFYTASAIWHGESWPPWMIVCVLCSSGLVSLVRSFVLALNGPLNDR